MLKYLVVPLTALMAFACAPRRQLTPQDLTERFETRSSVDDVTEAAVRILTSEGFRISEAGDCARRVRATSCTRFVFAERPYYQTLLDYRIYREWQLAYVAAVATDGQTSVLVQTDRGIGPEGGRKTRVSRPTDEDISVCKEVATKLKESLRSLH